MAGCVSRESEQVVPDLYPDQGMLPVHGNSTPI